MTPSPWVNQPLVLYHGTILTSAVRIVGFGIELAYGRPGTDFGRGFYATTVRVQAERWARRVASDRSDRIPALVQLVIDRDELSELEGLSFVSARPDAEDFWSLVKYCRAGAPGHKRAGAKSFYDVVFGPVTSNWDQRSVYQFYDQISFHTPQAEQLLNNAAEKRMILL